MPDVESPARIVVGVDGSTPSIRALHWAADHAAATAAELDVVTAWTFPEHAAPLGVVPEVPWPEVLVVEAAHALEELVTTELGGRAGTPLVVTRVERGTAGQVLVQAARGAQLLVVGNRGRSPVTELLLGSVSEYCIRHASCPVAVVRGR